MAQWLEETKVGKPVYNTLISESSLLCPKTTYDMVMNYVCLRKDVSQE